MKKALRHIFLWSLLAVLPAACTREARIGPAEPDDELAVEFSFFWPEETATKSFDEDTPVKTAFQPGDMIHILGEFQTEYLTEDGSKEKGFIKRYGALTYSEKKWQAAPGNKLTWPSVATKGKFTAYYVSGSNGVLTGEDPSATYLLSSLTPESDPLRAESAEEVYGHGVQLSFSHCCAHLTLVDLEPMVADAYWFKRDGVDDFHNAFRIVLGSDDKGPTLNFEFFSEADPDYGNLVYIAGKTAESQITDGDGQLKTITKVGYFLEPGLYDTFSLCYPAGKQYVYEYLKYDYNAIPDHVGNVGNVKTEPDLKANGTYTLTITKSPGITIQTPPNADEWDEGGQYHKILDVAEFLRAVNNNDNYYCEEEDGDLILEKTATGTRLRHNIDFDHFNYADLPEGFVPNVMGGSVFDGDHHYIRNLGSPLFRYNFGTIRNVGIQYVDIAAVSYEDDVQDQDMSRHGALCMWNQTDALISNLRVSDVRMDIQVKSEIDTAQDGSETHNIGCVAGSNTGSMDGVSLSGTFALTVRNYNADGSDHPVNASVLIGGIVGQNAATGKVYDVSPFKDDLSIRIENRCTGEIGSYSVGGIVGVSSGVVTGVILSDVTVDGTASKGVTSYMGGIAGELAVSSDLTTTAAVHSCIVSGSVSAGVSEPFNALTSGSYVGGIAGADLEVAVIDCRASVAVSGAVEAKEGPLYATGGAFGRIREAASGQYRFENLILYGASLRGADDAALSRNYCGNFAGIAPKGQSWEDDYANKNIIVRIFDGFTYFGGFLDSNNRE